MINKYIIVFILLTEIIFAQSYISKEGILKDSSYTVFGYYKKELAKFPFIKIAKKNISDSIKTELNIVYKSIGNRDLKIDLFYPESFKKKLPIVIFIHGGGWRSGDKSFQHPMASEVASHGYLCAAVEYRLSPEAKYPAAILDIKSAIKWLKYNAANYDADSSKVTLSGCSSGGHLAALCGVTKNISVFEPGDFLTNVSSDIQSVIDIDGILDFTHPAESGKDTSDLFPSVGKLWLGESFKNNSELWIEASPLTYISANSPSFFFINSSLDRFHAGRDSTVVLFDKFRIDYYIHTFPDTPHTFWLFDPWFNSTTKIIVDFLNKKFN